MGIVEVDSIFHTAEGIVQSCEVICIGGKNPFLVVLFHLLLG